jgi:ABC-type Fe3+/spermidine/putrescine transport system ATPase subunit
VTDEPYLAVDGLVKTFDAEVAVNGVTFGVERGKILTLLGPSGCGKTTTLRCIAGLETPTAGSIHIAGELVASVAQRRNVPSDKRNIGMVFQSYAVWPHMTVAQNLELPLEVRRVPYAERQKRIREALELVGLTGLGDRYANRLSGGQQQRVALARAMIYNPRLLLFDEPLSNLDAKLRERMRHEIRKLQREVGITSVYVTHDQAEAMIISDRIIVMNRGRIEQEGDARTLYMNPASPFVATFLGVANLVPGVVQTADSDRSRTVILTRATGGEHTLLHADVPPGGQPPHGDVYLSIRPEDIVLRSPGPADGPNTLAGRVTVISYLGNLVEYVVWAAGREWRVQAHPHQLFDVGAEVSLELPPAACLCLPVTGQAAPHQTSDTEAPRSEAGSALRTGSPESSSTGD